MEDKDITFVGPSCGHHAHYTFYKAIKYVKNGVSHILGLGEFFFVKIWPKSDLVAIGEIQLLWEDKATNQILSSLRLYFLPEYTPEGRTPFHGEDEVISVSEKAVLRVADLLDWIANPKEVHWDRGILGVCHEDCVPHPHTSLGSSIPETSQSSEEDKLRNGDAAQENGAVDGEMVPPAKLMYAPNHSDFLTDVRKEKAVIGDEKGTNDLAVIVLSQSKYSRYRSILQRISGKEKEWMGNSLIVALGGFTCSTRKTYILFCRDSFDYAELEEHPYLCNHLAPKLKGRPRKKRKPPRTGSPGSESGSSESSVQSSAASIMSGSKSSRNGLIRKDLLSALCQKNTKEEMDFLKKLTRFMEKNNTPIERPPMLGFKQIDLHLFFDKVNKLGGYEGCVSSKAWKTIYDELGGNPQNTSAATCTRRHYEKFLLPYEKHLNRLTEKDRLPDEGKTKRSAAVVASVAVAANVHEMSDEEGSVHHPASAADRTERKPPSSDNKEEENLKENPLITPGLRTLMDGKQDSKMSIDPDGKRLQIDDLIIIPNTMQQVSSGGSALQNLAKIASRYQDTKDGEPSNAGSSAASPAGAKLRRKSGEDRQSPSAKKPRMSPDPSSDAAKAQMALQQQLLSMFSPVPGSSGTKGTPSPMELAAAMAMMGMPPIPGNSDPSKMGQEGVNFLQLYEKQLNQMAAQMAAATGNNSGSSKSEKKTAADQSQNLSGSSKSPLPTKETTQSARDKIKVCKLPPETKRPPTLLQTACAFSQTSSIYSNPLTDLNKAREANKASGSGSQSALDLTVGKNLPRKTSTPLNVKPSTPQLPTGGLGGGTINLKKESSLLKPGAIGSVNQPAVTASAAATQGIDSNLLAKMNMDLAAQLKLDPITAAALQNPSIASQLLSPYLGLGLGGMSSNSGKSDTKSPFSADSLLGKSGSARDPKLTSSPSEYLKSPGGVTPPPKRPSDPARMFSSPSSSISHERDLLSRRGSQSTIPSSSSAASAQAAAAAQISAALGLGSSANHQGGRSSLMTSAPSSSAYNSRGLSSSPSLQGEKRGNPWHTPVSHYGSKPPEAPKSAKDFQSALLGLGAPSSSASMSSSWNPATLTSSTTSSSSQPSPAASAAALAGLPNSYPGLSPSSLAGSASTNPYLALMGLPAGTGIPPTTKSPAAPPPPPAPGLPPGLPASYAGLMDPATSAYYAALYSQQMYGLLPYGLGGPSQPGVPPTPPPSSMRQSAPSSIPGLDSMQASALQAMLGGNPRGPSGSAAGNPFGTGVGASASNPFASLAGMPGFFPPPTGRKD